MAYPIERKLVVGVSSNALFSLEEEEAIFQNEGLDAYRKVQEKRQNENLSKGIAYPFIKRFLRINEVYHEEQPVEVVLISKNSPETGIRIFNSIKYHDLTISRGVFTSGRSPYEYIPPFNISLFLSTNDTDVQNAINSGYAAGRFLDTEIQDSDDDHELRVAFDFDGVIEDTYEKHFQLSEKQIQSLTREEHRKLFEGNIHEMRERMKSKGRHTGFDVKTPFDEHKPKLKIKEEIKKGIIKLSKKR